MAKNESAENYLETILILSKKLPVVRSVDIATELGYKKSRGDMKGSIIVSLLTTISDYINETVGNFTDFSDFHLHNLFKIKLKRFIYKLQTKLFTKNKH